MIINGNETAARLEAVADRFTKTRMTVIGDVMLDEYMWGDVRRISPEAPVPVVEVENVTLRLGGAANVVNNLTSVGIKPTLISCVGNDETGIRLIDMLAKQSVSTAALYASDNRPTTIKTRIMARHQQVVRADRELIADLNEIEEAALVNNFMTAIPTTDAVILSDYGKGVLSASVLDKIGKACRSKNIFTAVDPKDRHYHLYSGLGVITPNLKEAYAMAGKQMPKNPTNDDIETIGRFLLNDLKLSYLLLTLSERGMALFSAKDGTKTVIPTVAQKVFDVTGAGDTVISIFTAFIAAGATPLDAAYAANHAAGLTVAQLGTAAVTIKELLEFCRSSNTVVADA